MPIYGNKWHTLTQACLTHASLMPHSLAHTLAHAHILIQHFKCYDRSADSDFQAESFGLSLSERNAPSVNPTRNSSHSQNCIRDTFNGIFRVHIEVLLIE